MFSVKRFFVAVATAALVATGAAYAGWASEGAGDGPTDPSADGALIVVVDPAGVQGLYPGASTTVDFRVKNDSGRPVSLRSARPHGFAVDAAHADCLVRPDVLSGGAVLLHGNLAAGAWSSKHQVRIAMAKRAGDACKGARFTFRLYVSAGNADV
jgi:hypothetical protein